MSDSKKELSEKDRSSLIQAKRLLEEPGIAIRAANLLGWPIEKGIEKLPTKIRRGIEKVTEKALGHALTISLKTIGRAKTSGWSNASHKLSATFIGAAGGFFGLPALAVELPISTMIMLRSIADIAKHNGEDLTSIETKLSCLEVFALGNDSKSVNPSTGSYYIVRASLAREVSTAAEYIAEKGLVEKGSPVIVRLISRIAARFSVSVEEKTVVEFLPVVGALGGASINYIFINHFQDMAKGHFIIRRLERDYGIELIQRAYEMIKI